MKQVPGHRFWKNRIVFTNLNTEPVLSESDYIKPFTLNMSIRTEKADWDKSVIVCFAMWRLRLAQRIKSVIK